MQRSPKDLLRAQVHAAAVLGATLDVPGASLLARRTREPRTEENVLGGTPATIVRPTAAPPWPALVFVNGATPDGRAHPLVLRMSIALARSGIRVFIPDLPGIAGGELSPATLAEGIAFAQAAADAPEAAHGRVALSGVSVGGTLALLVAAEPALRDRISTVAAVAPYTDLAKVMQLATTGTYPTGDTLLRYPVPPYLGVGLARSLAAMLPPTTAAAALCAELRAIEPESAAALEWRVDAFREAGDDALTLLALLSNRDPARFDELFAALPADVRSTVTALSPIHAAPGLRAPVEIATAPDDKYFPVAESRALADASPHVRLTVTSLLTHATPRLSPRYLAELGRLNGFFVRALAGAHR